MDNTVILERSEPKPESAITMMGTMYEHMLKYKHIRPQYGDWIDTCIRIRGDLLDSLSRMKTNNKNKVYAAQDRMYEVGLRQFKSVVKKHNDRTELVVLENIPDGWSINEVLSPGRLEGFFKEYAVTYEATRYIKVHGW